eukprot:6622131-Pyramimonas_sp.AAC.1
MPTYFGCLVDSLSLRPILVRPTQLVVCTHLVVQAVPGAVGAKALARVPEKLVVHRADVRPPGLVVPPLVVKVAAAAPHNNKHH